MSKAMIPPKFYAWDRNGKPLAFGKVYTYQSRTNAEKPTYKSEDSKVENTNPVILSGEGYADIYLSGSYKIVVKDSNDNEIWSADPVTEAESNSLSYMVTAYYISSTSFKALGNHTGAIIKGGRVKFGFVGSADKETTVLSSAYDGEFTVVLVEDALIRTDVTAASTSTGFGAISNFQVESKEQLEKQEDEFQSRFSLTQPAIEWQSALIVEDNIQLYSTGLVGESGYSVWLPDPNKTPFTASSTFAEDQALDRWKLAIVSTNDWTEEKIEESRKKSELEAAAIAVGAKYDEVIYSTDTTTVLDDVLYIHDSSAQVTFKVPALNGAGETIISVNGTDLVTSGGSYALRGISLTQTTDLPLVSKAGLDGVTDSSIIEGLINEYGGVVLDIVCNFDSTINLPQGAVVKSRNSINHTSTSGLLPDFQRLAPDNVFEIGPSFENVSCVTDFFLRCNDESIPLGADSNPTRMGYIGRPQIINCDIRPKTGSAISAIMLTKCPQYSIIGGSYGNFNIPIDTYGCDLGEIHASIAGGVVAHIRNNSGDNFYGSQTKIHHCNLTGLGLNGDAIITSDRCPIIKDNYFEPYQPANSFVKFTVGSGGSYPLKVILEGNRIDAPTNTFDGTGGRLDAIYEFNGAQPFSIMSSGNKSTTGYLPAAKWVGVTPTRANNNTDLYYITSVCDSKPSVFPFNNYSSVKNKYDVNSDSIKLPNSIAFRDIEVNDGKLLLDTGDFVFFSADSTLLTLRMFASATIPSGVTPKTDDLYIQLIFEDGSSSAARFQCDTSLAEREVDLSAIDFSLSPLETIQIYKYANDIVTFSHIRTVVA